MLLSSIVKQPHQAEVIGVTPFMSNNITQDMKYARSMKSGKRVGSTPKGAHISTSSADGETGLRNPLHQSRRPPSHPTQHRIVFASNYERSNSMSFFQYLSIKTWSRLKLSARGKRKKVSRAFGRSVGTISSVLKKNDRKDGYRPTETKKKYRKRKPKCCRKRILDDQDICAAEDPGGSVVAWTDNKPSAIGKHALPCEAVHSLPSCLTITAPDLIIQVGSVHLCKRHLCWMSAPFDKRNTSTSTKPSGFFQKATDITCDILLVYNLYEIWKHEKSIAD